MTTHRIVVVLAFAAILSIGLFGGIARAQSQEAQPTTVTVADPVVAAGKPVGLSAKITDKNGRAIGNVALRFYVETEVFGPRLMKVGEATTDSTGTANVTFKPTWEGENKISVLFPGTETLAASRANTAFNFPGPVKPHENAEFGLQTVRDIAPYVVAALVAGIWLTFAIIIVRVLRAMRSGPETTAGGGA